MTFQTQSAFITGIVNLVLAFTIISKGIQKPLHRAFAQLSLCLAIWNISFFFYKTTGQFVWNRLLFVGVLFIPASAMQFVLAHLPRRQAWHNAVLRLSYIGGLLFLASVATSLFDLESWSIAVIVFIFPTLLIALGILYRYSHQIRSIAEQRRLRFLSTGGLIATLLAPTDFLPGLGISFPQLGTIAILAYMYAVATGILRFHLFDLPEMIAKGVFLLLQIFLLGGILIFLSTSFGYQSGGFLLSAILVTLAVLLMEPLRRSLDEGINRLFENRGPGLRKNLKSYSDRISVATSPGHLENMLAQIFEGLPGIKKVRLIPQTELLPDALFEEKAAPLFLKRTEKQGEDSPDQHGVVCAAIPLLHRTNLLGTIEIEGSSGALHFSNREIEALMVLANQVASVLVNIRALEEIQKKERLAALGELSAGLAHEIRNPLGAIKGAAQFLQGDRQGEKPDEYLRIILEEANRLNRVVAQFLDYARPFRKNIARVDLETLLRKSVDGVIPKALASNVKTRLEISESLTSVEIDPDQIKQVLHNLIVNAVDSMPQGGELMLSASPAQGDRVEIAVVDTGVGIPPENLSRLFQPFFTTKQNGTGLGLAICYRIVEGHGGTIRVESKTGKGSRFRIVLPINQPS